jgi:hypothetical protein
MLPARDVVVFRAQIQVLVDRLVAVRNARVEYALNKARVRKKQLAGKVLFVNVFP